jgi:hypothetical protein
MKNPQTYLIKWRFMKIRKILQDWDLPIVCGSLWVGSILDQGLTIKLRSVFLLRKGTSSSGHSGLIKHMHIISDHPNDFPFFPFSRPNNFYNRWSDQRKIYLCIVVPNNLNVKTGLLKRSQKYEMAMLWLFLVIFVLITLKSFIKLRCL